MPHLAGLELPLAAVSNFSKGVFDIESGHRLLLSYDRGVQLNTTWVCSALPRPSYLNITTGECWQLMSTYPLRPV